LVWRERGVEIRGPLGVIDGLSWYRPLGLATTLTPEIIAMKLDGSRQQKRELFEEILRLLDRITYYAMRGAGWPTTDRDDLVQEAFFYVLRDDAKLLRAWDPDRATLMGYLSMAAGRFIRRRLLSRSKKPRLVELGEASEGSEIGSEELFLYRAALEEIYDWIRDKGSKKDQERFFALYEHGHRPKEIAAHEGISVEAIYTWKARLNKRLRVELPHVYKLIPKGE